MIFFVSKEATSPNAWPITKLKFQSMKISQKLNKAKEQAPPYWITACFKSKHVIASSNLWASATQNF
jgi:hypothetical protein